MMPKLSKRLQTIADLVESDSIVADVGTDHGYLPAFLINSCRAKFVFAGDIVTGPLDSAKKTIEKYEVDETKVKLLLSDGLKGFDKNCADTIIIAGMGSVSMIDIISGCDWVKSSDIKFIVQPQNDHDLMRQFLYSSGFAIEKEIAVYDQRHIYTVMLVRYSGKVEQIDSVFAYLGRIPDTKGDDQIRYVEKQIIKFDKQIQGLLKSSVHHENLKAIQIQSIKNEMVKVLERMKKDADN